MSLTRRHLLAMTAALGLSSVAFGAFAADVLNVGSYPNNPPFEYKTADGGFEGFEVDIVNEAAKRAGMTTSIADYDFQALFSATTSGRIDVAISSITITKERLGSQSFTQPYYDSDMGVAIQEASPLTGLKDLKGKISIRWTIDTEGNVGGASATADSMGDSETTNCLLRTLRRMKFEKPEGGVCVVQWPFVFSPG